MQCIERSKFHVIRKKKHYKSSAAAGSSVEGPIKANITRMKDNRVEMKVLDCLSLGDLLYYKSGRTGTNSTLQ